MRFQNLRSGPLIISHSSSFNTVSRPPQAKSRTGATPTHPLFCVCKRPHSKRRPLMYDQRIASSSEQEIGRRRGEQGGETGSPAHPFLRAAAQLWQCTDALQLHVFRWFSQRAHRLVGSLRKWSSLSAQRSVF